MERQSCRFAVLAASLSLSAAWAQGPAASTVVSQLKGYTAEDAYDLAKVEQAFAEAPAELFAVVASSEYNASLHYEPTPAHAPEDGSVAYRPKKGQPEYTVSWMRGAAVTLFSNEEWAPVGTVVLVWSRQGSTVQVVSTDGAAYRGTERALKPGHAAEKAAPSQPFVSLVGADLAWLEKKGFFAADTSAKLDKARAAAAECNEKVWSAADPEFDKIAQANVTDETRDNRRSALQDKTDAKMRKTCAGQLKAVSKLVDDAVKQRSAARSKLEKAAAARLAELK